MPRNDEDFLSFENRLFSKLIYDVESGEIDYVVNTFVREVTMYYNLETASVFFIYDNLSILRGIFGLDRYLVCKVAYKNNAGDFGKIDFFSHNDTYIGKNINMSQWDVFNHFETMMASPIKLSSNMIGHFVTRSKTDKIDYFNEIIEEIRMLLKHFAVYASAILQNVKCCEADTYIAHLSEIVVGFAVDQKLTETFDGLSNELVNMFNVQKAVVLLFNDNKEIYMYSIQGMPVDEELNKIFVKDYDEDIMPSYINGVESLEVFSEYRKYVSHSIMIQPLKANNKMIGLAALIDKIPNAINPLGNFSDIDLHLFTNILSHVASNIHNRKTLDLLNEETKINVLHTNRLNILYELSNALLGKLKEQDILFILMTAMTLGEAFGHNRSFAFLYDEESGSFKGKTSVAPVDSNDAASVWDALGVSSDTTSLQEKLLLLYTERDIKNITSLTKKMQKINIVADERCKFFETVVKEKKTIVINNINASDEKIQQIREYTDLFGYVPFAIIPMIGASKECVGIIVVDNYFTKDTIEEEDIDYIKMFANQIAIAIEYSRLYESIEQQSLELRRTQDKLTESKHLALIGQMSSSISHNLRNFLVPITGFANRLKRIENLDEEVQKYVNIISDEMTKLEYYIKSNLSFSKAVQLNTKKIPITDIESMIRITAEEFILQSKKKIKFKLARKIEDIVVVWDYNKMSDVFLNLLLNATDAVPEDKGSSISILIEQSSYSESMLTLHFKNTNSYIGKKLRKEIFDPFFTTKAHGSGLGLTSSLKIVEAHGGSLSLDSSLKPRYTDFIITIPITVG